MSKKIELYEGRPVFQAKNSKELAKAVEEYDGEVEAPYVVRLPNRVKMKACSLKTISTVRTSLLSVWVKHFMRQRPTRRMTMTTTSARMTS